MGFPNSQSNSAGAIPVWEAGGNFLNLTTNLNDQIKSGAGVLKALSVNTAGTTSSVSFYDGLSSTVTITLASPGLFTWPAHGLVAGSAVKFTTTGALPTGLTANTTYYVTANGALTANTFNVSDTQAHALAGTNTVNTSVSQSGVHTGWNVTNKIGTFATTAQGLQPIGARTTLGLIAITTGGAAADITVLYL